MKIKFIYSPTQVVQLLLNRGALLHRDHNGRNPLHLAAMSGYTQTIELLHSVHSHLLDQVDKDGVSQGHLQCRGSHQNHLSFLSILILIEHPTTFGHNGKQA